MKAKWVDFHCHLDLYSDHECLIAECDGQGIATLAVTTTPRAFERNAELAERSSHVRVALGLHPQLVAERADEIGLFEKFLAQTRYVGEVGLDAGPRFYKSFDTQEKVFSRILRACSEQGGKILSVHSVRTAAAVLKHVERWFPPGRGTVVLHWFTGTPAEARWAAEMGCYFSVNSEMLKSSKGRTLTAQLPIDRILTETDGPFVLIDGAPARPASVAGTVGQLASVLGQTSDAMALQIVRNLGVLSQN